MASWRRDVIGGLSAAALLAMAVVVPGGRHLRKRALIAADTTFSITTPEPGLYQWSLQSAGPEGPAVRSRQVMAVDRGDLAGLELETGLRSGDLIAVGQPLARLLSSRLTRQLADLRASMEALQARRQLLEQGGRPEEIDAARQRVRVALARRELTLTELQRLQQLDASGAVGDAELQNAQIADRVAELEVSLASAGVAVTRSSARPEKLAEIDAKVAGIREQIAELELRTEERISSPIAGVLQTGDGIDLITVHALDQVYARFPVEEALRSRLVIGTPIQFRSESIPNVHWSGELTGVGSAAELISNQRIFWAIAAIPAPDSGLMPGMTGVVELDIEGGGGGIFGNIWRAVTEP